MSILDILQQRFCEEKVFNDLFSNVKYFTNGSENKAIRRLYFSHDPRVRTDCRCQDFPAYKNLLFPNYNANQYEGYTVCEGPNPLNITSLRNFFTDICFNENECCIIDTLIVVGDPAGKPQDINSQFVDYFSHSYQYQEYEVSSQLASSTKNINQFSLRIKKNSPSGMLEKTLTVYQLPNVPDHNIAVLTPEDVNILHKIADEIDPARVALHCAAGLGRSPSILFSFILFKKFSEIFSGSDAAVARKIVQELALFRSIRPAAIQNPTQLQWAISLALAYKGIDWNLYPGKQRFEMLEFPTIAMIGAFDTKGQDYQYLYQKIIQHGFDVLAINTGISTPKNCSFPIDITPEFLLQGTGFDLGDLWKEQDRPKAVLAIKNGLKDKILSLCTFWNVAGVIGIGGTNGTEVITKAMRKLPVVMRKICISTVAQHENWVYGKANNITLVPCITDVGGVNPWSSTSYDQGVDLVCSNEARNFACLPTPRKYKMVRPNNQITIGITMFGNTTACVERCQELLEQRGYRTMVFHAVGTGGKNLEKLVKRGEIQAVLDITTHEVADFICGGVFSAGPKRMNAPAAAHVPWVIVPGCVDMINFNDLDTAKSHFPGGLFKVCNKAVTVVRTNEEQSKQIGRYIAEKANAAYLASITKPAPVCILLPLNALSMFDATSNWHDEKANQALFSAIETNLDSAISLERVNAAINDIEFAERAVVRLVGFLSHENKPASASVRSLSPSFSDKSNRSADISFISSETGCISYKTTREHLSSQNSVCSDDSDQHESSIQQHI
ncbi:MAG: hypothetical protein A2X78_01740 [Gammaproteobacteria bacterium GWE2_37_16]|nr:MAG: hypothetical protein A2X78_01740 [Gammaproteobacteria bacterium GWE2_37_16]